MVRPAEMITSTRFRPKPLLFALGSGCAGFAVNHLEMPIFGSTAIIFGGVFSLLVAFTLGPAFGGLAAAIAFSKTWLEWQHPAGLVCYTLEAVIVGWLVHRRKVSRFPATALYWLVAGTPLALLFVEWLKEIPFPSNWAILVKYPLNGLLVASIALPLSNSERLRRWIGLPARDDSATSLQTLLFSRVGVIAVLPLVLLILMLGQTFDRNLRGNAEQALEVGANDVAGKIEAYLAEHRRDLVTLGEQLRIEGADPDRFASRMNVLLAQYPGFLTLLVADTRGDVIASAPAVDRQDEPPIPERLNVADRDYFREAMRHARPFIGGVFRRRGFGDDPIVAISTPILDGDGRPRYVLEGSLNLKSLIETLAANGHLRDRQLVIADRAKNVVLAVGNLSIPALSDFRSHTLFRSLGPSSKTTAFDLHLPGKPRAERHLAINTHTAVQKLQIVLLEPLWLTQKRVAVFYLVAGVWSIAAISVALLLARSTAAEITRPLQQLVRRTRALALREPLPEGPVLSYPSSELTEISMDLQNTAQTLIGSNEKLAGAMEERDQSHRQLRQVLFHLDERVQERTAQLDEAREAAESANHAKSEFLASMSHELRTPLNVILGMSEVLREQTLGPLNPDQVESVSSVEESGRHLLALINDILDLSKIEAGMLTLEVQEVDVRDICAASLRFVRESASGKRIALTASYGQQTEVIPADARRLKQILVNLLSNAVKFTPQGGNISLEVTENKADNLIEFHVQDNGIGIAAENLPKLFKSFQQIDSALNRKFSGTGLGLALVKRMTEMHGGKVSVVSAPDAGARFTVALPLNRNTVTLAVQAHATSTNPFTAPVMPGEPLILVAEDHPTNRLLLDRHLRSRGCRVIFATNGQEAIERVLADHPALVLMDVQMPVLDGLEATRRLRANPLTAGIPIIILTALAMPEDRLRCLEAGANAYLSKPLQLAELDRLMHKQINRDSRSSRSPHDVLS